METLLSLVGFFVFFLIVGKAIEAGKQGSYNHKRSQLEKQRKNYRSRN